ncbi:hypothetical protein LINPERHAP1_LOCUS8724 [Linum perenne]
MEVDFAKPFLGKYAIEHRNFHVEYEILENIYFCGMYGHKEY